MPARGGRFHGALAALGRSWPPTRDHALSAFGLGLSDRDRELRLRWRLTESVSTGLAFEVGLDGTRRESSDGIGAEHGIGIGAGWRFVGPSRGATHWMCASRRRDATRRTTTTGAHKRGVVSEPAVDCVYRDSKEHGQRRTLEVEGVDVPAGGTEDVIHH